MSFKFFWINVAEVERRVLLPSVQGALHVAQLGMKPVVEGEGGEERRQLKILERKSYGRDEEDDDVSLAWTWMMR